MSFKLRNTLFLITLVLLLSAGGFYVLYMYYPSQRETVQFEIAHFDSLEAAIPARAIYLEDIQKAIEENKHRILNLDKVITTDVSMAEVFTYLDQIQRRYGSIEFAINTTKEVDASGYGYKIIVIAGEGAFESIMSLIWSLEKGPGVYAIDRLNMHGVESIRDEGPKNLMSVPKILVPFEIQMRALYADVPDLPVREATLAGLTVPDGRNIFMPEITRTLPPNTYGALEAERAELRVILPDRAIIADHEGQLHVLKEGDPVYLGYMTRIDTRNNIVEFTLNKGGIIERFKLGLGFSEK